jgi:Transglutaminase-like superfamily
MTPLRKFLLLAAADRRLLVEAALLLETIKLGMRLLPFRTLRGLSARAAGAPARGLRHAGPACSAERVGWAVEAASRHGPGAAKSCLVQALAAQVLLARHGHPALLRIGVARREGGRFQAHAWVESGSEVVVGGSGHERFTPLTVLGEEGP